MHKGRTLEAYKVWKRIRGVESLESKEEFFLMKVSVQEEEAEVAAGASNKRFPWVDFFTYDTSCHKLLQAHNLQSPSLPPRNCLR